MRELNSLEIATVVGGNPVIIENAPVANPVIIENAPAANPVIIEN